MNEQQSDAILDALSAIAEALREIANELHTLNVYGVETSEVKPS